VSHLLRQPLARRSRSAATAVTAPRQAPALKASSAFEAAAKAASPPLTARTASNAVNTVAPPVFFPQSQSRSLPSAPPPPSNSNPAKPPPRARCQNNLGKSRRQIWELALQPEIRRARTQKLHDRARACSRHANGWKTQPSWYVAQCSGAPQVCGPHLASMHEPTGSPHRQSWFCAQSPSLRQP
jgi:hypothetical protein